MAYVSNRPTAYHIYRKPEPRPVQRIPAHQPPEAIAYAEQTRRIAEIRKALVADGMDWAEANDEAVERVLIAADHHSADDAADAIQQETR